MERGQKRGKGAHSCLEGAERRPPGCLRSSQVGVRQGQGCGLSASQGTSRDRERKRILVHVNWERKEGGPDQL